MTNPGNRVTMCCRHLASAPLFQVSAPYSLRWYAPGDVSHWVRIHLQADLYTTASADLFKSQFGTDEATLALRQCYLLSPEGEPIGTATAWFGEGECLREWGRVHWVAIDPAWQGRGLAKPLLAAVCERLRECGYRSAYLTTSTSRLAALNLYAGFGFVPAVKTVADVRAWQTLLGDAATAARLSPSLRHAIAALAEE